MNRNIFNDYIDRFFEIFSSGDAREESYYTILETAIKLIWKTAKKKKKDLMIIVLPKKNELGNPDMVIRDPHFRLIGYIEAKSPLKDLDKMEETEQVKRYRAVFPNFILTNFLEFRFYRSGQRIGIVPVFIGFNTLPFGIKPVYDSSQEEKFLELMTGFFNFTFPLHIGAKEVAEALAIRTRFVRDQVVLEELKGNSEPQTGMTNNHIAAFYQAFKTYLIHGLSKEEFADLYSQTLTFGLFTAATRCTGKFTRETAVRYIPQTGGILHDIFEFISMGNVPKQLACSLDDMVAVLKAVDCNRLLNEYYKEGKGTDPVVHFYETFLSRYDPELREQRGVYYTPEAVVSFIVRAVNWILKEKLNRPDGLADPEVRVLDPAAGTAAFLVETARIAIEEYAAHYGEGTKSDFAHQYLLKNLFGFEVMMAPYAVAHLKMSYILKSMGLQLEDNERFNLYLTNTLEMENIEQSDLPGMATLSRESRLAGAVKRETPLMVVLGNPPYAGHSLNHSQTRMMVSGKNGKPRFRKVKTWIGEKINDYKLLDGQRLDEKNIKWLQDDYVKYLRFGQHKIDENGEGIMAFITNHAYLDNPTFRGMRQSLMTSFNEIYILDLHGNASKKEKCPDRSRDENIFDIRQGVSIGIFVKKRGAENNCQVFHTDIWGSRKDKYKLLQHENLPALKWAPISPWWDYYFLVPRPSCANENGCYSQFPSMTMIFPVYSVGIVTARDYLTIKETPEEVMRTIHQFVQFDEEKARLLFGVGDDTRDWKVKQAQKDLMESGLDVRKCVPILYRPFDKRFTYFTGRSRGFHCMPRPEVMKHMLLDNLGLITVRQVAEGDFNHCFVADTIVESRITTSNKGIGYLFPLYLYPHLDRDSYPEFISNRKRQLFNGLDDASQKRPNIDHRIIERLILHAGFSPAPLPEHIFYYIYAVLFSTVYRKKYADYLKFDFPRIPFTSDKEVFLELAGLGEQLVALHRMTAPELNHPTSRFEVTGHNRVDRFYFVPESEAPAQPGDAAHPDNSGEMGRVYINHDQYFSNISREVWEYHLGGYPVLAKFLKFRRGKMIGNQDTRQFILIAACLQATIRYQEQIDRLYPRVEEHLIPV
ncbi:MAG: type ISP restriction/modification enzyme [Candidatus Omnitrophota bacterium]